MHLGSMKPSWSCSQESAHATLSKETIDTDQNGCHYACTSSTCAISGDDRSRRWFDFSTNIGANHGRVGFHGFNDIVWRWSRFGSDRRLESIKGGSGLTMVKDGSTDSRVAWLEEGCMAWGGLHGLSSSISTRTRYCGFDKDPRRVSWSHSVHQSSSKTQKSLSKIWHCHNSLKKVLVCQTQSS